MIQQRAVTTRDELKDLILLAFVENIPGGRNGPDESMLSKANAASSKIMSLVDAFLSERGIQ